MSDLPRSCDCMNHLHWSCRYDDLQRVRRGTEKRKIKVGGRCNKVCHRNPISLSPGDPSRAGSGQDDRRSSDRNRLIVMVFPSLQEVRGKRIYCSTHQSSQRVHYTHVNKEKQNQQDCRYKQQLTKLCKNESITLIHAGKVFFCNTWLLIRPGVSNPVLQEPEPVRVF